MHTLERIYPKDLNPQNLDEQASLHIHIQRYEFAAEHLSGLRVLDIACGCGYGTALLAERNPDKQVTGVDIDPAAIAYAHQHYPLPNLRYECVDAEQFSSDQGFDCIVSLETIEHLPCPQQLLANYARLLADGGKVIASVPITPTLDGNPTTCMISANAAFMRCSASRGLAPASTSNRFRGGSSMAYSRNRSISKNSSVAKGRQCCAAVLTQAPAVPVQPVVFDAALWLQ
jgi:2-polyprenyl-3-methyl-5-hydroxy-6-metoxy-1,4-benzoquinol methylase